MTNITLKVKRKQVRRFLKILNIEIDILSIKRIVLKIKLEEIYPWHIQN